MAASRAAFTILLLVGLMAAACNEPYRIGEYVWVEWEGREYPAYIIAKKNKARFRVHFDGYDSRWDKDVSLDQIKGRIDGPVTPPPPPEKVARSMGLLPKPSSSAKAVSPYKVGDRVRARWRGSVYAATIVAIVAPDRFLIHYDGHESEWDETVSIERIVGRR